MKIIKCPHFSFRSLNTPLNIVQLWVVQIANAVNRWLFAIASKMDPQQIPEALVTATRTSCLHRFSSLSHSETESLNHWAFRRTLGNPFMATVPLASWLVIAAGKVLPARPSIMAHKLCNWVVMFPATDKSADRSGRRTHWLAGRTAN